jgi:hypothetical protein
MIRLPTGLSARITGNRVTEPTPLTCWANATAAPTTPGKMKATITKRVSQTRARRVVGSRRTTAVGATLATGIGHGPPAGGAGLGAEGSGSVDGGAHSGGGVHWVGGGDPGSSPGAPSPPSTLDIGPNPRSAPAG